MNLDGNALYQFKDGALIAIIAIVMVFVVLLIIIGLTELITKLAEKTAVEVKEEPKRVYSNNTGSKLNINDEDATIACLIASIDYRIETGKQIEVLSVREVK